MAGICVGAGWGGCLVPCVGDMEACYSKASYLSDDLCPLTYNKSAMPLMLKGFGGGTVSSSALQH